jgi:predicted NBD/HSP70 family sugar kinase
MSRLPANSLRAPLLSANERMILDLVRRREPIARSAMTSETNLSQQSVHRIVEDLLRTRLVQAGESQRKGRGKPSPMIQLKRTAAFSLGLSLNTDSAVVCLVDMSCRVLEEVRLRLAPMSRPATVEAVHDVIRRLLARNGLSATQIVGLGVGIAGFFVAEGRQVNAPEPMQDWSLVDLVPIFEDAFGFPVRIENNATTAAIGESLRGIGLRRRSFGYLSFNYGFGGGVIVDGKPLLGAHRNAGEMSGVYTRDESPNRPALRYLLDALRQEGVAVDSIEDLSERFDPTWPGVVEWVERVTPYLNRIINSLAAIIDPEAIVFGGQISPALARMLIARAEFRGQHRYGVGPARPELVVSEVAGDAAAAGAAMLPLREAFYG